MRMRVDLPEPDRPMTTKISPFLTSNEASMTAAVAPSSAAREKPSRRLSDGVIRVAAEDLVQAFRLQGDVIH
ncbi:hypothetical protein GCM10025876_29940 [Demequina litorisediminis]|uniref:Uncharacterized protein n=1 Tax=Demequina litorisediminis TaxID=1849022 RepID=A0ABQ6IFX3_9MICO|nr:hypothetical protein GCM10025876_29940 [Demequina litorisediminis]